MYSLYPQINIYQYLHILKVLSKCSFNHLQGRFSEELPLSSISNKLSRGRFCHLLNANCLLNVNSENLKKKDDKESEFKFKDRKEKS